MSFRGYIIGAALLLCLLAATSEVGAGITFAMISLFSDNVAVRTVLTGLGSFFGFVFGAMMCCEAIAFASATLKSPGTTTERLPRDDA